MASNKLKASGYDLDWVEDPPDDLKCLICFAVAKDPKQHTGYLNNPCGKIFCNTCIEEYLLYKKQKETICPNCRQNLLENTLFMDSKSSKRIKALKVKCNNLKNGCNWTGELGSLETHLLQSCDYGLVLCNNKCENYKTFYRKDLPNHLANDCPRRQYECPHCQETGEHQEMTIKHPNTCPKVEVQCPNSNCQDVIARCNLKTHRSTCAYESVPCMYAAVGCEEKPLRKDLTEHEQNDQLHLRVTTKKVLALTKEVQQLTKINSQMFNLTPCTLKLTNYQQWKSENKTFYSPPFYTSYSGYKMCLRVYANGQDSGTGTHVSVFVHLMKGDHDDALTWPFPGSVTFELLNQLEDDNHHKKTITFQEDNVSSKRVVDGERARWGLGWLEFISHAALNYNATTDTQYLKDDTLVFRVSVEVPNHKPWLDCTV